jgi:hypothetical protein
LYTIWFIITCMLTVGSLAVAIWYFFDPDDDYNDKEQRTVVRRALGVFLVASLWPIAFVTGVLVLIYKMVRFAFPRVSEA